jgi:hypothetical protein
MTDEPTPIGQAASGSVPGGEASATRPPPESRPAGSPTGRSQAAETRTGSEPEAEPDRISGPRIWPRVVGVLILLVGAGGAWIWQNPGFVQSSLTSLFPGAANHATGAAAIQALEARVARLEQRPPADLAPLTARLDALEQRLPPPGQATGQASSRNSADLRPLLARLDALEAAAASPRPAPGMPQAGAAAQMPAAPDLRPLIARLDALEKQEAEHSVDPARVDALAVRIDALSAGDRAADVRDKLNDVEHRLSELAAGETKLADTSGHATRLAQLEIALAAGHPLGAIPDAPPALAHFATTAPPTEAGLRLAFTAASQAALKVSEPDTEGKPFLDRVLARLQDFRLITVREGDRVVIGNSAAATLVHAQVLLDAGDLSGAVRAVETLSGPAAARMAPWLADAKALQAAREALASLAEAG